MEIDFFYVYGVMIQFPLQFKPFEQYVNKSNNNILCQDLYSGNEQISMFCFTPFWPFSFKLFFLQCWLIAAAATSPLAKVIQ